MLEILRVGGGLRFRLGNQDLSDITLPIYIAEEVLAGGTAQLCGRDRFCRIDGGSDIIRLSYSGRGEPQTCYARWADFANAIRELDRAS